MKMYWICWRIICSVTVLQNVGYSSAKLATLLPHVTAELSAAPEMVNNILLYQNSAAAENWQNVGDDLIAADVELFHWSEEQESMEEGVRDVVQRNAENAAPQDVQKVAPSRTTNNATAPVNETVTKIVKNEESNVVMNLLRSSAGVIFDAIPTAFKKQNNNDISKSITNTDTNSRNKKFNEKSSKQQISTAAKVERTTAAAVAKDVASATTANVASANAGVASADAGVTSDPAPTVAASKATAAAAEGALAATNVVGAIVAGIPKVVQSDDAAPPHTNATATATATATMTNQTNNEAKLVVAKRGTQVATSAAPAATVKQAASNTIVTVAAHAPPPTENDISYSNNESNQRHNANSISSKSYLPNGFINPFGQLVAFFGSDQLQLQNYHLFFNAERHTVFQLHTNILPQAATGRSIERVRNVVSESLGAVFGVNSPAAMPAQSNIKVEEVQLYNAASLRQSRFNPFNPTRILIHGWFGGANAAIYQQLVPAYLRLGAGNYNVFTVDWGRGAVADYLTASYRVKPVGKVLAKFIDFLQREAGIRYEDVHVVGFSMGAHIAGIAGKHVQTGRLPVIYALDPALPFFRYERIEERVAITDADYVEVIHTSVSSYGYDRPLGHVDFYVNYGSAQPGCYFNECSHFRAYQVFAEALQPPWPDAFAGHGCDVQQWRDMIKQRRCAVGTGRQLQLGGDPKNVTALRARGGGVYYVATTANPPYALAVT